MNYLVDLFLSGWHLVVYLTDIMHIKMDSKVLTGLFKEAQVV